MFDFPIRDCHPPNWIRGRIFINIWSIFDQYIDQYSIIIYPMIRMINILIYPCITHTYIYIYIWFYGNPPGWWPSPVCTVPQVITCWDSLLLMLDRSIQGALGDYEATSFSKTGKYMKCLMLVSFGIHVFHCFPRSAAKEQSSFPTT